ASQFTDCAYSPCDQHPAIKQQRRRMKKTCGVKASCRRPGAKRRIVELRTRELAVVETARDQHLAVGQQGRRVVRARYVGSGGCLPCAARRIVDLGKPARVEEGISTYEEHLAARR